MTLNELNKCYLRCSFFPPPLQMSDLNDKISGAHAREWRGAK